MSERLSDVVLGGSDSSSPAYGCSGSSCRPAAPAPPSRSSATPARLLGTSPAFFPIAAAQ
uniref:Uncharacterized protein n=1 Tax=Leersia perrieri TaxID=77586 RepID=A0A0D9W4M5_9ORYZ